MFGDFVVILVSGSIAYISIEVMSPVNVLVSTFQPFPTVSLSLSEDTELNEIPELICARYPQLNWNDLFLSSLSGRPLPPTTPLSSLAEENSFVSLRISPRLYGGKGGFGSQLRAAGGRMSSQKTSNNDSCRDLSGRRLSTVKEAKKLAEYIESEPERKKAAAEAQKEKLEKLERKLGIDPATGEPITGVKRRLDDTEYLEQSKEIVDSVRNAVTAGMFDSALHLVFSSNPNLSHCLGLLKKKKKAKLEQPEKAKTVESAPASTTVEAEPSTVAEKIVESAATAPAVAVASVAVAAVSG
ncbi:hypothetical protein SISSUDRAFT_108913 [Sistotremastrum suecicum HHB10207 ss-3]|nr:hypothetical protein SISSUDRAFT_108913 [Sistotremastrum suecicum HHB10207 ss-3]